MDSEIDLKKRRFLTVYTKDYVNPPHKRVSHLKCKQEFKDPISDVYKKYLVLDETNISPPYEDAEQFLEKHKHDNKVTEKLFKNPLNKQALYQHKRAEKIESEYNRKYCNIEKDQLIQAEKVHEALEYVNDDPPLTTYLTAFRLPTFLRRDMITAEPFIPIANLHTKGRFATIPRSEYEHGIGHLGGLISESMYRRYRKDKEET